MLRFLGWTGTVVLALFTSILNFLSCFLLSFSSRSQEGPGGSRKEGFVKLCSEVQNEGL